MSRKFNKRFPVALGIVSLLIGQGLLPDIAAGLQEDQPRVILQKGEQRLVLPSSLEQLLSRDSRFKNERLSARHLTGNWARFAGTNTVPYAIWGDFTGDGRTDVAMLFAPSDFEEYKAYIWDIYAFHQDKQGNFIWFDLVGYGFKHNQGNPRPIQNYRLVVHKAQEPIRAGNVTLPYTYPLDSIALVRILDDSSEEIERVYAWDPKIGGYRRTILDALGKEAAMESPEPDLPKVVGSGTERTVLLPKALEALLERDFPHLQLPGPEDMNQLNWAKFTRLDAVPWAAWGDYNGDGLKDIALMLLDQKGGTEHWRATVFMQTDNHSYESSSNIGWFNVSVGGQGKVFLPNPPQWYYLVTALAGSKIHYNTYPKKEDQVYPFDAVLLTNLPEKPVDKITNAEIRVWEPRYGHFQDYSIGVSDE